MSTRRQPNMKLSKASLGFITWFWIEVFDGDEDGNNGRRFVAGLCAASLWQKNRHGPERMCSSRCPSFL
jgi:hypothetical protein